MSLNIGTSTTSRWSSYTAWMQLHNNQRRLAADIVNRAGEHVLAADRAAVRASEERVRQLRPGHILDVTA
jgi:hypothetical protein